MKCPKCGYVSFDHLDDCKRCGKGLSDLKIQLNIPSYQPRIDLGEDLAAESAMGTAGEKVSMDATESVTELAPGFLDEETGETDMGGFLEDESEGVLGELSITEIQDEEESEEYMDLTLEEVLEKPFSLEDDIEEGILEELEPPSLMDNQESMSFQPDVSEDEPTLALKDDTEQTIEIDGGLDMSDSVVDDDLLRSLRGQEGNEDEIQKKDMDMLSQDSPEIEIIEIDEQEE